ncbi:J domain-containing protein [Falsiroseomonas oryziterrae]|uniref:J domain-containing protein n=1 Tax=Falsiroseomonas oryziterrae TaxID=2911368 RepID=UPI001F403DF6|nr:J domain-containing protein [Roseomonas sp. NPKOSM-4]
MPRRSERIHLGDPEPVEALRACESPGCALPGEYRAPRDRARLNEYRWFCLEHVREYNRAWDYYKGMGPAEIERELRSDSGWQRPTWPLGRLGGFNPFESEYVRDPLGVLRDTPLHKARREPPRRRDEPPAELRAALDVLDLAWPLDQATLRARYKDLAKRYHPDANGGDRQAEERLKDINRAYSLLRRRVGPRAAEAEAAAPAG